MPVHFSKATTRGGYPYVSATSSGEVSDADTKELTAALGEDGPYGDLPVLGFVKTSASFSTEAREFINPRKTSRGALKPVAIVVSNAPMRSILTFVAGISRSVSTTRFFRTEALAMEWLDEVSLAWAEPAQPRASSSFGYAARKPHAS